MGPTGEHYRVVQIHPTRRCNLRCLHCYSSSGPEEREEISEQMLALAIDDGLSEGYSVISFSGGEPLMYRPLPSLLRHAKNGGVFTTVTTNGMLSTPRKLEPLRDYLDLLAISLDGIPESHNRMRNSPQAFGAMLRNLETVRSLGIEFGFIFTLTQHNVHELDWVAQFAVEQGAALLQIHPLEETGRAQKLLSGSRPDEVELAFGYAEAMRLRSAMKDRLRVQLDVSHRAAALTDPERFFGSSRPTEGRQLADLLSPLIIEPDGHVVPLQYGFPRILGLGSLYEDRLELLAARWKKSRYGDFLEHCRKVYTSVTGATAPTFFNWYEEIQAVTLAPVPSDRP